MLVLVLALMPMPMLFMMLMLMLLLTLVLMLVHMLMAVLMLMLLFHGFVTTRHSTRTRSLPSKVLTAGVLALEVAVPSPAVPDIILITII